MFMGSDQVWFGNEIWRLTTPKQDEFFIMQLCVYVLKLILTSGLLLDKKYFGNLK